ncbi:hypothetical protein BJY00DRAFT_263910 [Aspergillus carlsbadensis]|nr:hypothetical protein BJY00DRAFT_263910 [Aspergillus carlsbadensis]
MATLDDPTSSDSSSGSGIYNALRASSDTSPANPTPTEHVDRRMAANVAMFCSISSETPCRPRRNTDLLLDRPPKVHLADRLRVAPTGEVMGWSLPDRFPEVGTNDTDTDDIASDSIGRSDIGGNNTEGNSSNKDITGTKNLNAAANVTSKSRTPRWPQNVVPPASPTLPEYPPPVRSPTPPGIPSFGSEEARSYDFRFNARPQVPARGESLLRRLFQRAQPNPSGSQRNQRHRIFAGDGTAVMGSFPQRQSGHGAHMLGAEDHPFHNRNLSLAQFDGPGADCQTERGEEPSREPGSLESSDSLPAWITAAMAEMEATPPSSTKPSRPDSYQTCASRPQASSRQVAGEAADGSAFFLGPTQSTTPTNPHEIASGGDSQPKQSWSDVAWRVGALLFRCCYKTAVEPGPQPNSTTQDTYITARDQVSNESPQPRLGDQAGP